jgi:DNA-binding transcriptional MerR regulator
MRIGELSAATGLTRETLRFYEARGLLVARRRGNGYRDYPEEAVEWLCYLRTAQALGFTLAEIETGLPLLATGDASAPMLREALRRKLKDIDARIAGLAALRADLAQRLEEPTAQCPLQAEARDAGGSNAFTPRLKASA